MLHAIVLHAHNGLRWVILAAGLAALAAAARGLGGDRPYAQARRVGVAFMAALHLQLLLGLSLFFTSPFVGQALRDMKATMADAPTRFFIAEHPTVMVAAVVLATVGGIVAKNAKDDASRHRKALVFIAITLAMILWGIPWHRPMV
jgi:hypothetical protein